MTQVKTGSLVIRVHPVKTAILVRKEILASLVCRAHVVRRANPECQAIRASVRLAQRAMLETLGPRGRQALRGSLRSDKETNLK